jgi:hypothetical protein
VKAQKELAKLDKAIGCLKAIAANRANIVLTMLKWSCVDTAVVRCGCSSLVGHEFRFQPLLPYVSRKLRTDAGVWCPCTPRTLVDASTAFHVVNGSGPSVH